MSEISILESEIALATALGTPRAASWDDDWLALVGETEARLGRRICGAHAPDGEPCELASTHRNGRCRFHGGHPRIGAQPGNTNALVHGLYSRRLRQCSDTCPMWESCPFAGPDVMKLSPRKRPVCAYESQAYATATGLSLIKLESLPFKQNKGGLSISAQADERRDADATPPPEQQLSAEEIEERERDLAERMKSLVQIHSLLPPRGGMRSRPQEPEVLGTRVGGVRADGGAGIRASGVSSGAQSPPEGGTTYAANAGARDARWSRDAQATFVAGESEVETKGDDADVDMDPADRAASVATDAGGILYAMLQRATVTLASHALTDHTEAASARYTLHATKMSAALTAFLHIARELRAWLRLSGAAPANTGGHGGPANVRARKGTTLPDDRPMLDKRGHKIPYDAEGNLIGLPDEWAPYCQMLDDAVEQLRSEGVDLTPPSPYFKA